MQTPPPPIMSQTGRRQEFLFDSLDSKVPNSARKFHIRRLADLLQVCIHRGDLPRARRAWEILVRCPEFDWKNVWQTGLLFCSDSSHSNLHYKFDDEHATKPIEYLRVIMLRSLPENRAQILEELTLWLIKHGRHRDALDELELYLPLFPYHDISSLHSYAGLLCFFLAHPQTTDQPLNMTYLHESQTYMNRALELDPSHPVPIGLLAKLEALFLNDKDVGYSSEVEGSQFASNMC